ncbi:MAG: hypothetical protein ABSE21_20770, partial [Bryobacteraceae bacterium]
VVPNEWMAALRLPREIEIPAGTGVEYDGPYGPRGAKEAGRPAGGNPGPRSITLKTPALCAKL